MMVIYGDKEESTILMAQRQIYTWNCIRISIDKRIRAQNLTSAQNRIIIKVYFYIYAFTTKLKLHFKTTAKIEMMQKEAL